MARIVRPMIKDITNAQLPQIATRGRCLGVRETGPNADIDIDGAGNVLMNQKGMSVSADWRTLKPHLIPVELDDGQNGACGKNMAVFVHGQGSGAFAEGAVGAGLEMIFKNGTVVAGNVCPIAPVQISQFQSDLAGTQMDWVIDPS